jgi:molybdate transport system substrate-binding protein
MSEDHSIDRRRTLVAALLALLAPLAARAAPQSAPPAREKELVVYAAASLRDAFAAVGEEFKRSHPDVQLSFNFAGSQELRTQIEHGAPADVFASADLRHMDELRRAGRVAAPVLFARNEPVVVVAKEQASRIRSLADLPAAGRIVIGVPEVPIGRYTLQILDRAAARLGADFRARVEARVVSRELNVKQVLAKVSLGEADAGIVYRTDAASAGDRVGVVAIPQDVNIVAEYPLAALSGAAHPALAEAWVRLVLSPAGQAVLRRSGFVPAASGGGRP